MAIFNSHVSLLEGKGTKGEPYKMTVRTEILGFSDHGKNHE